MTCLFELNSGQQHPEKRSDDETMMVECVSIRILLSVCRLIWHLTCVLILNKCAVKYMVVDVLSGYQRKNREYFTS